MKKRATAVKGCNTAIFSSRFCLLQTPHRIIVGQRLKFLIECRKAKDRLGTTGQEDAMAYPRLRSEQRSGRIRRDR